MFDNQVWDGLDRRHFMVTAIGASAALAANTNPANAQAAPASRGTIYTGDLIDGKKVISSLNIDDLEPGNKHLFYFQGVQTTTGQNWHVSTIVCEGHEAGQACRAHQRCARRRDKPGSHDTDRHGTP